MQHASSLFASPAKRLGICLASQAAALACGKLPVFQFVYLFVGGSLDIDNARCYIDFSKT